jgi:hypothetical protein
MQKRDDALQKEYETKDTTSTGLSSEDQTPEIEPKAKEKEYRKYGVSKPKRIIIKARTEWHES